MAKVQVTLVPFGLYRSRGKNKKWEPIWLPFYFIYLLIYLVIQHNGHYQHRHIFALVQTVNWC